MTDPDITELPDGDLPGMWSQADFTGGQDEAEDAAARLRGGLVVHALRHEPGSVADALDVHLHLTVLSAWVNERKTAVTDWLKAKGEARLVEDGAAPTWRLDDGTVLLTDPKPKPAVEDRAAFASWYENASGELLPRRRTATAPSHALLTFADEVAPLLERRVDDAEYAPAAFMAVAAGDLYAAIDITEEVLLPEDVLDRLLAGDVLPVPDVGPRVVIHTPDGGDPYVVDTVDGGPVPGVTVRPASPHVVQVRPTPKAKTRVRAELDRLLGPPVLGG